MFSKVTFSHLGRASDQDVMGLRIDTSWWIIVHSLFISFKPFGSLAYIHTYIHTYIYIHIHLKHENDDKWYKNGGWIITYIENVYTRHVKDIYLIT